jgi:hypothetical protein
MEILLFVIAVAIIVPACVTRSAGHAKNRDYGVWYGLLLGWLGVLAMIAMPALPAKRAPGEPRIHPLNRWTTAHPLLTVSLVMGAVVAVGALH